MYRGKTKKICLSNYGLTPIKIKHIWKSVFEGCNSKNPDLILITSLMRLDVSGCFTSSTSLLIDFLNHLGEISTLLATVGVGWGSNLQWVYRKLERLEQSGLTKEAESSELQKVFTMWQKKMCNRNILHSLYSYIVIQLWYDVGHNLIKLNLRAWSLSHQTLHPRGNCRIDCQSIPEHTHSHIGADLNPRTCLHHTAGLNQTTLKSKSQTLNLSQLPLVTRPVLYSYTCYDQCISYLTKSTNSQNKIIVKAFEN